MDLILWRHAEAHVAREGQTDLERALTHKGERQAQRMAEWLNQRLAHSTRVLASPAVRTQQTARALGRDFKTVPGLAPDASPEALLRAVRWPGASEPVLVVGHQPTLGLIVAQLVAGPLAVSNAASLAAGSTQAWPIKKCSVWWLRQRDRDGESQVTVQAVQLPELL